MAKRFHVSFDLATMLNVDEPIVIAALGKVLALKAFGLAGRFFNLKVVATEGATATKTDPESEGAR